MTEFQDKNGGNDLLIIETPPKESFLALLSDDSEINKDQEAEGSIQINIFNFKELVMNLVKKCHLTQRFKVTIDNGHGQKAPIVKNWGLAEINHKSLRKLLESEQNGTVGITKIPLSQAKVNKLNNKNIERKRSVAFAKDIIRGLALYEMTKMLNYGTKDVMNEKEKKALKNKFTNCSRRDRSKGGAGAKLEEEFLKYHKALNKFSGYKDIDEYFEGISIFIFGCEGYLTYVSNTLCTESVYFYVNAEDEFFLVRNIKGFCRID